MRNRRIGYTLGPERNSTLFDIWGAGGGVKFCLDSIFGIIGREISHVAYGQKIYFRYKQGINHIHWGFTG